VLAETRIALLRQTEASGDLRAARAATTAAAERRRLHAALFAGARRKPAEVAPAVALAPAGGESAADRAWRDYLHSRRRNVVAREAPDECERLTAEHGPASCNALLYDTLEEQHRAEEIIARSARHGNTRP
jgi:hypothetical protein